MSYGEPQYFYKVLIGADGYPPSVLTEFMLGLLTSLTSYIIRGRRKLSVHTYVRRSPIIARSSVVSLNDRSFT